MKITNVRRTRNVKMADMPESLRLHMARNGMEFRINFPEDEDDEERITREVEKGVYDHTKGLYCLTCNSDDEFDDDMDAYQSRLDFAVKFEDHEDLERFEKNFLVMFKLSN